MASYTTCAVEECDQPRVLTGGLSLFATGLSRKQQVTRLSCGNCGVSWTVE